MFPHRLVLRVFSGSALALLTVACSKDSLVQPDYPQAVPLASVVVSDPVASSPGGAMAAARTAGDGVAYVSLPPKSLPATVSVTIRNVTAGALQTAAIRVFDGGFDPVPVVAKAGDELELRVITANGASIVYRAVVAKRRPPAVVRTNPPKGVTDVALNTRILVVFTEPVAPATVTTATIQLLQGTTPVPGSLMPIDGNLLAVEFIPDKELDRGTEYRLVVTRGVRDTEGDSLEAEVATDFTTVTTSSVAVGIPIGTINFRSISFRVSNHLCGLDASGLAYCWGDNHASALGAGSDLGYSDTPLPVSGARRYSSLSAGYYATCAIEASTGFAYCWGYNAFGDLGDGTFTDRGFPSLPWVPTEVVNRIRFSSISASGGLTCGVEVQTGLGYCWGKGGATGDGTMSSRSIPTLVGNGSVRFSNITTSGKQASFRAGEWNDASFACGLELNTGLAYCWGRNNLGQLGDGTTTDRLVPTLVGGGNRRFSRIDAAQLHTCGIEIQSGLAYCWGVNGLGQLGDGTTTDRPTPTAVSGNLRFTSISAGDLNCGIEAETSAVYCWGRSNPAPRMVGDGSQRFSSLVAAYGSACGVEAQTGRAYCWEHTQLNPTRLDPYPAYSP